MAPMTSAERQRKYREKLKKENPEKLERLKKENAERTKKNYKKINELSDNVQKEKRKQWREKQKKKLEKDTSVFEVSENDKTIQKEKRKVRYILSKENLILKERVQNMSKIIKRQRKAIYRYKKKMKNLQQSLNNVEKEFEDIRKSNANITIEDKEATPYSKTERLLQETVPNIPSPDKQRVKKAIFEGYVLKESLSNQYSTAKSKFDKIVMKNVVNSDVVKKYKLKTEFGYSCLGLKGRLRQRRVALEKKKMRKMKEIQHFLERDDNSRITAGKRETRTHSKDKKQVRYLLDSLEKLHKKYKEEGGLASYTVFTRYKPFYILDPKITQRNTCACVKHANLSFLAQKLKAIRVLETDDLDMLVSSIACDTKNEKRMYNECKSCENKTVSFDLTQKNENMIVSWNAWVTKTHEYTKSNNNEESVVKTKKTIKDVMKGTLETLIKSFSDQLGKFKKHYFNVYHAYQMYKKCKDTLTETECIIHCDFSENYLCKSSEEVQATHFGASKQQFTLHTGVIYYKNGQDLQEKSFCTISPNNNHGPIAIWAHLTLILEYIKKTTPCVTSVHFFSDGPTTQYRQKANFYLMSEMVRKLGFQKSTWSFFESAHGKGAADGIGGAVKRTLDRKVTYGEDITDAKTAYEILGKCQSKIMYFYISNENEKTVKQEIDLTGLIPVPHTMEIHQIITTDQVNVIKFRKLACFCKEPMCECFGLEEHNLKIKKPKRKYEGTNEIKKTIKRKRTEKSRKRSLQAVDSDTSIESHITYAESDDSLWNLDEEYDPDDKYGNDGNENDIHKVLNENNIVSNNTKNSVENINKKVTILSVIKNTPENCRYFNLKNYGPLSLNKVDTIGSNINQVTTKFDVNKKRKDISEEMEKPTETKLNMGSKKKAALEEENIILEENSMITENYIGEYHLKENTKKTSKTIYDNPSIIYGVKEKSFTDVMEMNTEVELTKSDANKKQTETNLNMGCSKEAALEEKIILGEENSSTENYISEYHLKQNTKKDNETIYDNPSIISGMKEKSNTDKMEMNTKIETRDDPKKEYETDKRDKDNAKRENKTEGATNVNETLENIKYNINDSVLVRYFQKKTWIYYVGFIEDVKIETNVTHYYSIKFLKTLKKPHLKFKMPKKIDRDTVPAECVVKTKFKCSC